jgi:hypothetical protein
VIGFPLSKSVLNTKTTTRIFPFHGATKVEDFSGD